jgi:uncharacterized protein (TIGR02266 family)
MTQDTRKDPRAKVLTMTVRYKSATLDEFIEHHSHDVSRGGMFIKTPSPFPPGTLLKFEVKIAAEQRVMQGVGRVVWKREAAESSEVRPAGMGVKFIKIDDESRRVIDQLVTARGDGQSHFEQGADGPGMPVESPARAAPPKVEQPEPSAAPPRAARKSTMIGLGAMGAMGETPAPPGPADAFFPKSNEADMPAPEDRTVMKQAAELLQEALREAGGSLDEVGSASVASSRDAKPPAPSSSKPDSHRAAEELVPQSTKPKSMARPAAEKPTVPAVPAEKPKPAAGKPVTATASRPATAPAQRALGAESSEGGGGKVVLVVAAVALVAGVVFFATRQEAPAPEAPSAEPAAALPPPEAASPPTTAVAPPAAPTPPVESGAAAPPVSAAAPPTPPPPAEPPLPPPVPAPVAVPKAAARAAVRAKPKAAVEAAPSQPAAPPAEAPAPAPKPAPAEAKPAPAEPKPAPAEAKPAEPPAAKPAATPKPAPAPAPKKPASNGDNPY